MSSNSNSTKQAALLQNMEEVKRVFNCFDTNGDGKISSKELGDILRALGSYTTEEELKQMMAEIDTDGDGFIDIDEFAEFHKSEESSERGASEMKDAFDMYDKDQNGLVSASELHMVLNSLGEKCSIDDCGRMIKSVDSDGDGYVNFEEFKKMMKNGLQ
ncbi:hypothetical protein IFM89_003025 [Coptis chinensis]|uniref:EF-hand domain-containing protein n=1 Tax=Coptis chinensis TaxID=261450 RepID=A0A835MH13_9MAGN|nr:hypothetical protein IFM89_003025 [Coptis chinensis]